MACLYRVSSVWSPYVPLAGFQGGVAVNGISLVERNVLCKAPGVVARSLILASLVLLVASPLVLSRVPPYVFTGNVYQGDSPDTRVPVCGVSVELYGDQDEWPENGARVLLTVGMTNEAGEFVLYWEPRTGEYPYYHVMEVDPPGALSTGARAEPPGYVKNFNVVSYLDISPGEYAGISFWDIYPESVPPSEGWCCGNGEVFPSSEPECLEQGGGFFFTEEEARHHCQAAPTREELPDLSAAEIEVDPLRPYSGEELTLRSLVSNVGNAPAEDILVLFLVDGQEIATQVIRRLEPGQVEMAVARWTATTPGDHRLLIEVDPEAWIMEPNEENNWGEGVIEVRGREAEVGEEYEVWEVGERNALAPIIVPVSMYYLERYFSDVPDKTRVDMEIKSILDESPEGRELLGCALENYQTLPEEAKCDWFDSEIVQMTSLATESLDFAFIRDRIRLVAPGLMPFEAPNAPSGLVAKNISAFEPVKYQIQLTWQDNSLDESGFQIYRTFAGGGGKPQLISTVPSNVNTYIDSLSKPSAVQDQYCYEVIAYKTSPVTVTGQSPATLKSSPSNTACSYYSIGYPPPPPLPDWDGDGIPDKYDQCPKRHANGAIWTHGCPDADRDGVIDDIDKCPLIPGEGKDGCPIKYTLRWMGMDILNNSGAYAYSGYNFVNAQGQSKGLYFNEGSDKFGSDGEEPYLVLSFTNGMVPGGAALDSGTTRWCCGERVDVKQGKDYEPDNDSAGEENPLPWQLKDLQDHGLTVFPAYSGQFAPINDKLGLIVSITLAERDWTATITPEQEASKLEAAFKVGGAVAGAIGSCVASGGIGCLASIGGALKTAIESIFGLSQSSPPVTVNDPDDYQGTNVWAISRQEAEWRTSTNGAYAFYIPEMPIPYSASCLGWEPCSVQNSVPVTMRARLYFCLYREGTTESQIKAACSSYQMVLPWPMTTTTQP